MSEETTTQTTAASTADTGAIETARDVVGSGAPDWANDFEPEIKDWVSAKGYKSPEILAKSYRELESKFGADRAGKTITLPENGDAEAWSSVYNALGRPETPEGYELTTAEGADPEITAAIGQLLFDGGVSFESAKGMASKVQEIAEAAKQREDEQWNKASAAELDTWKREQGGNVTQSIAAANAAARQFDLSTDDVSEMERALGTGRTMELLKRIGAGLSEDTLPKEAGRAKVGDIQGEIDRMKADPGMRKLIRENDYATKQKWDMLHEQLRQIKGNPYQQSS